MARKRVERPEVASQQPYLDGVAKNLADKLYGPNGPPRGTRFADLEELAVELGQTISRALLDRALACQAAAPAVDPVDDGELCPTCGEPGAAMEPEPRAITTRAGVAEWSEPRRHCHRCRRSFFPSVTRFGD